MLWSHNASKNLFSSGPPLPKGKIFLEPYYLSNKKTRPQVLPTKWNRYTLNLYGCTLYIFKKRHVKSPPPPYEVKKYVPFTRLFVRYFFNKRELKSPPYKVTHTFNLYHLYVIFSKVKKCIPLEISEIRKYKGFLYMFGGFSRLKFLHCQRLILETLLHTRQWCVCVCRSSLTFRYR